MFGGMSGLLSGVGESIARENMVKAQRQKQTAELVARHREEMLRNMSQVELIDALVTEIVRRRNDLDLDHLRGSLYALDQYIDQEARRREDLSRG